MQRLFRRVGKLSLKSKSDAANNATVSRPLSCTSDILESNSFNAIAKGSRKSEPPTLGSISDENLTRQKRTQSKKKRNSLIESFRKLKRHSKSKDTRSSLVDSNSTGSVKLQVNEEPKINGGLLMNESETIVEEQTPSTRELSVNGDVPSLSLSVMTLRSLGSADQSSAVHSFAKPDVGENASGDIAHADFLAREVPVAVTHVNETRDEDTRRNENDDDDSCEQYGTASALPHLPTHRNRNSNELETSVAPPARSSRHQHDPNLQATRSYDDFCEDGMKIHDTLPVDLVNGHVPAASSSHSGSRGTGDVIQVVDSCSGRDASTSAAATFSSELANGKWSLMSELTRLSRYGWYWGPVTRSEAEEKLADQPEGAFLIRDSTDERYLFSLSFRSFNRTLHTRIEYCNGEFSFYHLACSEGYRSIVDLIEAAIHDSLNGIFYYSRSNVTGSHTYAVKLTKPVSRFTQVRSLQYLCRFIIRQHTRVDHIQNLPLPVSVKGWLRENQY